MSQFTVSQDFFRGTDTALWARTRFDLSQTPGPDDTFVDGFLVEEQQNLSLRTPRMRFRRMFVGTGTHLTRVVTHSDTSEQLVNRFVFPPALDADAGDDQVERLFRTLAAACTGASAAPQQPRLRLADFPRDYPRGPLGQSILVDADVPYLTACNAAGDSTPIYAGPSRTDYETAGRMLNGQTMAILDRIMGFDGRRYLEIIYAQPLTGGRLIDRVGYVDDTTMAQSCDVDYAQVVRRNTVWPVIQGAYGCRVSLPNETTLFAWDAVSAALTPADGGVLNIQLPLCQVSDAETVEIVDYLGGERSADRYHFHVRIDGCLMRYQMDKTPTGMSIALYHTRECPGPARGDQPVRLNGVDAAGNLFSLGLSMFMGGMDAISGGALSRNPPGSIVIDRETAMRTELESCESYYTQTGLEAIFGGSASYSYCALDYCSQTSNGSWFCSASPH